MKKLIAILTICLMIASCAPLVLSGRVKKLELGMTKSQVTSVMGNKYDVEGVTLTPEGSFETLRYYSEASDDYLLHFLNGNL